MSFLVGTNVVASQPPERRLTNARDNFFTFYMFRMQGYEYEALLKNENILVKEQYASGFFLKASLM